MIAKSTVRTQNILCGLPSSKCKFTKAIAMLFDLMYTKHFDSKPIIPSGFEDLIKTLYDYHKEPLEDISTFPIINTPITVEDNNNVAILFSGGLDSCTLALKLRDKGYNVTLFHVLGVNPYTLNNEAIYSAKFAKAAGFDYVEASYKEIDKREWNEHPLKNQFMLAMLIDYAIENNISRLGLGIDWDETTDLNDAILGVDETDAIEVNKLFWQGVNQYINLQLEVCPTDMKRVDRIKYLFDNNLLQYVYSCVMTHRFHDSLHDQNESKYGVKLLPGRCGSCNKCAREAILLRYLGIHFTTPASDDYINHCWKVLHENKFSPQREKYDPKIPYEQRLKTLLEEGS